jgi:hypothetical protein
MNKHAYAQEAFASMPAAETRVVKGLHRHDVAKLLQGPDNIGIELGVAAGSLARKFLDTQSFRMLFGVDVYGDLHDTREYKEAIATIGLTSNHKLLRLSFDDALDLFPDAYFDFVYVDGFAHTGEEGGKTLADWYQKLKVGGILCGDDYHQDWPLVMWAVNHLASQLGSAVSLTALTQDDRYSRYPTWFIRKARDIPPAALPLAPRLVEIAKKEKRRIHRMRMSPMSDLRRRAAKAFRRIAGSGRLWGEA